MYLTSLLFQGIILPLSVRDPRFDSPKTSPCAELKEEPHLKKIMHGDEAEDWGGGREHHLCI